MGTCLHFKGWRLWRTIWYLVSRTQDCCVGIVWLPRTDKLSAALPQGVSWETKSYFQEPCDWLDSRLQGQEAAFAAAPFLSAWKQLCGSPSYKVALCLTEAPGPAFLGQGHIRFLFTAGHCPLLNPFASIRLQVWAVCLISTGHRQNSEKDYSLSELFCRVPDVTCVLALAE